MCFYNDDYDWIAEVNEVTEGVEDTPTKCDECGRPIAAGEWRRHVHQHEHECCEICEENEDDPELTDEERIHECDYGETFEYDCCERCYKVIEAIAEREKIEGCPAHAQRPSLAALWEELGEHSDCAEYTAFAMEKFPELATDDKLLALIGEPGE